MKKAPALDEVLQNTWKEKEEAERLVQEDLQKSQPNEVGGDAEEPDLEDSIRAVVKDLPESKELSDALNLLLGALGGTKGKRQRTSPEGNVKDLPTSTKIGTPDSPMEGAFTQQTPVPRNLTEILQAVDVAIREEEEAARRLSQTSQQNIG